MSKINYEAFYLKIDPMICGGIPAFDNTHQNWHEKEKVKEAMKLRDLAIKEQEAMRDQAITAQQITEQHAFNGQSVPTYVNLFEEQK